MFNYSEKLSKLKKKSSFDYKPLETEYTNSNSSSDKFTKKNLIHYFKNDKLEKIDCSSIKVDNQIIHHPKETKNQKTISNKGDSFSIDSLNIDKNINDSPERCMNKPINFEFIQDVFNTSSSDNKKIMVSDLDITIETPTSKTQRKKPVIQINNNNEEDDLKVKLEKNILAFFERNKKKNLNTNNHQSMENRNEIKEKLFTDNINNNKKFNTKEIKNKIQQKNEHLLSTQKHFLCLTIMNSSSLKPPKKHKSIYKSVQRRNNKKSNVYQIVNEITEKKINSNVKKKNFQRANSSNLKRKNTKKSIVSNNSLINCSSTCTKGGNLPMYHNINIDYNSKNDIKRISPSSIIKNHLQFSNSKNKKKRKFSKNYSLENKRKEKLFLNQNFMNVKRVNQNSSNCENKTKIKKMKSELQKEKKNLIQNVYDSYIGNYKKKPILPDKFKQLLNSQSKNVLKTNERNTRREKKIELKTEYRNNNLNNIYKPITSKTCKIIDNCNVKKDTNNRRIDTDNSIIEIGKKLSKKYSFLLKQSKIKKK